jgi:hypothetical protein
MTTHSAGVSAWSLVWATMIHSAGYLPVSAVIALVVFEKLGLGLLRKPWINLDLVRAAVLVVTSVATLLIASRRCAAVPERDSSHDRGRMSPRPCVTLQTLQR